MLERPWDVNYVPVPSSSSSYSGGDVGGVRGGAGGGGGSSGRVGGQPVRQKVAVAGHHHHSYAHGTQHYQLPGQPSSSNSTSYRYHDPTSQQQQQHRLSLKSQGKSSSGSQYVRRRSKKTLKSLPDEVLVDIFRYAGRDSFYRDRKGRTKLLPGRSNLLSIALVCRRFQWIVTPVLYARLEINPQNEALVRETLAEDSTLAKHIHNLKIQMPKRFRTWAMKYSFSPTSFELVSNYGTDLDILQHFRIDPYSLRRIFIGDAMSVDGRMCKYIASNFPKLEDVTIESPVSFHSQWNSDGLERTVSFFFQLRRLKHLRLHINMNPSRTANIPPESTWLDLMNFLPKLPDRLQTLTFGSLGRNEEYLSVSDSLVRCTAYTGNMPAKRKDKRLTTDGVWSGRGNKWWKVEVPTYLKDRIAVLERWGVRLKLNELYLY